MANSENLMVEIDSIVPHQVESIDTVFDDLKKELATPTTAAALFACGKSKFLEERIDAAQQR